MTPELFVLLLAFTTPGALAIQLWDFAACRSTPRPVWSTLGYGAVVSLFFYAFSQWMGWIDLREVIDGSKIQLSVALRERNVGFFLLLTIVVGSMGGLASRAAHSPLGQRVLGYVLGRTAGASTWAEMMRPAMEEWVHIRSRSGTDWLGAPDRVPEHFGEGFLSLRRPHRFDEQANDWIPLQAGRLALSLQDIEFMELNMPSGFSRDEVIDAQAQRLADTQSRRPSVQEITSGAGQELDRPRGAVGTAAQHDRREAGRPEAVAVAGSRGESGSQEVAPQTEHRPVLNGAQPSA